MLKQYFSKYFSSRSQKFQRITALLVILVVAVVGTYLLTGSHAATPYAATSADKGTTSCGASVVADPTASDGNKVIFGSCPSGKDVTFTPSIIPLSAPELPNDMRGQYFWDGSPAYPSNWPLSDTYYRLSYIKWNQIETSPGVYNFSIIDQGLKQAQASGYKFGFRIIAFNPGSASNTNPLPSWITTEPNTDEYDGQSLPMPAWNDTSSNGFLANYAALMSALANHITPVVNGVGGVKLADDPRLGWVDMGGYGDWGEWHTYDESGSPITDTNMQAMAKSVVDAFPNTYVLAMDDNTTWLNNALTLSPKVGIRSDCLGTTWGGGLQNLGLTNASDTAANTRWQTAPFVTEWCATSAANEFSLGLSQVNTYHISLLSSDNFPTPASDPANLALADKTSGYRYQIDKATVPSQLTPGSSFTLTASWENVNVAPTYEPWDVQFELRNASGQVSWSGTSSLNLDKLLPTNGTPAQITDQLSLPSNLAPDTYMLAVSVVDPAKYLAPMNLADQGRTSDGAYPLGSVTVQ